MKDEHDNRTIDIAPEMDEWDKLPRSRKKPPKAFSARPEQVVMDKASCALMEERKRPECATFSVTRLGGAHFVPASFVAKDWKVTSRRICSLLVAGRLDGRKLDNGYWEVAYPYRFTFGKRGPALKRQQKHERMKE